MPLDEHVRRRPTVHAGLRDALISAALLATTVGLGGCSTAHHGPVAHGAAPYQPAGGLDGAAEPNPVQTRTVAANRSFGLPGDHRLTPSGLDGASNVRQVTFIDEGAILDPAVDRAAERLAFASTVHHVHEDIYIRAIGGQSLVQVTSDPGRDVMPAFSPDGTMIAFASDRAGSWDVYVQDLETGRTRPLTFAPTAELHPSWSPDGRTIAFCRLGERSGRWELWTLDLDQPRVGQRFLDYGVLPCWSPDAETPRLLFQRHRERGDHRFSIWTIDLIDGDARHPTEIVPAAEGAAITPAWTPDGRSIVYSVVREDQDLAPLTVSAAEIWVVDVHGHRRRRLTGGHGHDVQPVCAADGTVYFVSDRTGVENLWAVRMDDAVGAAAGFASVDGQETR